MVIILAAIGLIAKQNAQPLLVNDDRDVIQTSLLSFFKHELWHSADWRPKQHVVLRPKFSTRDNQDFLTQTTRCRDQIREGLSHLYKRLKEATGDENKRYKNYISEYEKSLIGFQSALDRKWGANGFKRGDVIPIPKLAWDKRIMITEESGRRHFGSLSEKTEGLESSTVEATSTVPSYSPDGSMATVEFGIPWSMHSADVVFLLERTKDGWVIRAVSQWFYV